MATVLWMSAPNDDDPDLDASDAFWRRQISDRGRTIRVLVALFLTLPGLVPIPYLGWASALPLLGPAVVLLAYAGQERGKRRGVLYCAAPTMLGVGLALFSVVASPPYLWSSGWLPIVFAITLVTTLLAAFFGMPR